MHSEATGQSQAKIKVQHMDVFPGSPEVYRDVFEAVMEDITYKVGAVLGKQPAAVKILTSPVAQVLQLIKLISRGDETSRARRASRINTARV